jgi:hypothetical protein
MKKFLLAATCAGFSLGCYVDDVQDRKLDHSAHDNAEQNFPTRSNNDDSELRLASDCRMAREQETGCLRGNIAAAMNLTVSGKTFFDADDLAERFSELVEIKGQDGKVMIPGKDYEFDLISTFGNRNFSQAFEVYIKGPRPDSARVTSSGKFTFNHLSEGNYEIRAQRSIRMKVTIPRPDNEPQIEIQCATLYQDASFEVARGEQVEPIIFDDFQIYTAAQACGV